MSLPREPKKSQPWAADLAFFAGVLAFLGYSLHAFWGARQPVRVGAPKPEAERLRMETAREPASQSGAAAGMVGSTEVLRLPCVHGASLRKLESSARLVQLQAPFCNDDPGKGADAWRARNESSGEEILVFVNRKDRVLSTSYFSLQDGENRIVLVEDQGKGKSKTETLQVVRKD